MSEKAKELIVITQEGFKITIENTSEVFGGADLQLKALISLMQFDFKSQEETDMDIRTKYYLTILNRLGEVMLWDDFAGKVTDDRLEYIKGYIEWAIAQNTMDGRDVVEFMSRFLEKADEE